MGLEERLMKEYEILLDIVNRLGNSTITIKGWAVTLVVVTLSIRGEVDVRLLAVLLLAVFTLWLVEASYRRVGMAFKARCAEIESYFRDPSNEKTIHSPAVNHCARKEEGVRNLIKAAFLLRVFPLYVLLIVGVIVLFII